MESAGWHSLPRPVAATATLTLSPCIFMSRLAERRHRTLQDLSTASFKALSASEAMSQTLAALAESPKDVPFALLYSFEPNARAQLTAAFGIQANADIAPAEVSLLEDASIWPLSTLRDRRAPLQMDNLDQQAGSFHVGPWPEAPSKALLLPLIFGTDDIVAGALILGISPRLMFEMLDSFERGGLHDVIRGYLGEAPAFSIQKSTLRKVAPTTGNGFPGWHQDGRFPSH